MSRYRDVVQGADIMYVNKIPFFMSISRNIRFATSEVLPNRTTKSILAAIKRIHRVYCQRGFRIIQMNMDGKFDTIRGELADMQCTMQFLGF